MTKPVKKPRQDVSNCNCKSEGADALSDALDALSRALTDHQRAGMQDILSLSEVSALLRCAEDTARRIPRDELPAYRVGKNNLYLRDEVIRYVRSRRATPEMDDSLVEEVCDDVEALIQGVIDSEPVDVREPSLEKAK